MYYILQVPENYFEVPYPWIKRCPYASKDASEIVDVVTWRCCRNCSPEAANSNIPGIVLIFI